MMICRFELLWKTPSPVSPRRLSETTTARAASGTSTVASRTVVSNVSRCASHRADSALGSRSRLLFVVRISVAALPAALAYSGDEGVAKWEGYMVPNEAAFRAFLTGPVVDRARDTEFGESFENELRGLATTGVSTRYLARFLNSVRGEKDWEVGEAFAESVLAQDGNREVVWPWNHVRDRRTPGASLPGADLVGFFRDVRGFALLFGEVKTSSDARVPPQVMYGRSGMTWQLETNATNLAVQHSLLRWLRIRCSTPKLVSAYREAVGRYVNSSGSDLLLVGVLLRDTDSDEMDVKSRARYLGRRLASPTRVEIQAWYIPVPIPDFPAVLRGGA